MPNSPRIAFAGDRELAVRVLDFLLDCGDVPLALLVSSPERSSHGGELMSRLPQLNPDFVLSGTDLGESSSAELLETLELDYVVAVHFPYIVPPRALRIARHGWLNLHPSFLPFNRGWHTATWALLDETPAGATLHQMDEGLDTGGILATRRVDVDPGDTGHSLYQRILDAEFDLFSEAWPKIIRGQLEPLPQNPTEGTFHKRADLLTPDEQRIELNDHVAAGRLLRRLRALTTNEWGDAAYYEVDGRRFRIRVVINEDPQD